MGKFSVERLGLGQTDAALFISESNGLPQCVQQPGLIEGWVVVSGCVNFDHATITIVGKVFVGTEEQLTSSMSNPAMESDIARMVVLEIMEDPLGPSVLRDYL